MKISRIIIKALTLCILILSTQHLSSQNITITDDNSYTPDNSAMLDVKSTTKGMLVPRMDSLQRVTIGTPAEGLLVYDTDEAAFFYYNGASWLNLTTNVISPASANVSEALFSVVNENGDTVFAVYPEGVNINVGDGVAKGTRGGFVVGALKSGNKLGPNKYLAVTPDSVRIYIDTASTKGNKGGFAVGGLTSASKGIGNNYLTVSADSVRVYIDTTTTAKGNKGGFAVGGLTSASKDITADNFLRVKPEGTKIQTKEGGSGFEIEEIGTSTKSYLDITPDNIFIGEKSGNVNSTGQYNTFLGFSSGISNNGSDNVYIGYKTGWGAYAGQRNVYIGKEAGYTSYETVDNVFIGYLAGYENDGGSANTFLGTRAGQNSYDGSNNIFVGYYAGYGSNALGDGNQSDNNIVLGNRAGFKFYNGISNVLIGHRSGYNLEAGDSNIFIGNYAGYNETGSGKLYVDNSSTNSPLIYGDFSSNELTVNGNLGIGTSDPNSRLQVGGTTGSNHIILSGGVAGASYGINWAFNQPGTYIYSQVTMDWDKRSVRGLQVNSAYGISFNDINNTGDSLDTWLFMEDGGQIGIGTSNPAYKLDVIGNIRATGSVYYGGTEGNSNGTAYTKPDFVFENHYKKDFDITEVEKFIKKNKHLPWVTSAKAEKEAINMTRMSFETLEAVENLQLQIIKLNKQNHELKSERKSDQQKIKELEKKIDSIEKLLLKTETKN